MWKIEPIIRNLTCVILILCVSLSINFIVPTHAKAYMMVYDSDGQYLGLGSIGQAAIYVPSLDVYLYISVIEDGNVYEGDMYIMPKNLQTFYELEDCSGVPYIYNPWNFFGRLIYKINGQQNYVINDYGNRKRFIPQSTLAIDYSKPEPRVPECRPLNDSDRLYSPCGDVKASETPVYYLPIVPFEESFPFDVPVALPLQYVPVNFMDVDGSGKTGLAEAIYSLQKASGLR